MPPPHIPFLRPRVEDEQFNMQLARNFESITQQLLSGSTGPYDAIVDANLTASDPANRNYRGIHEALADLQAEGYTEVVIAVRPGTYTETAALTLTTLQKVRLDGFGATVQGNAPILWEHAGFLLTLPGGVQAGLNISNIRIDPGGTKTSLFASAYTLAFNEVQIVNSLNITSLGANWGWYHHCSFSGVHGFGSFVMMTDCDIMISSITRTVNFAGTDLHATGVKIYCATPSGGSRATFKLPRITHFDFFVAVDGVWCSGGNAEPVRFIGDAADGQYTVICRTGAGFQPDITLTNPAFYEISGNWGDIVVTGASATWQGGSLDVEALTVDVTGPCTMKAVILSALTVRGNRVSGMVVQSTHIGGGTFLTGVAMTRCSLLLAVNNTGGGAGGKPYALDASCQRNALLVTGSDTYGSAGTDAGTNNRIMTETTDTVAAASVTTHEAASDPHTGYQKESEKGNANGYASLDGSALVPDAQIPSAIARDTEVLLKANAVGGWTTPTGTATRANAGFDTATITLPQLAEIVKALVDDGLTVEAIKA